jgi:hypothetical protein
MGMATPVDPLHFVVIRRSDFNQRWLCALYNLSVTILASFPQKRKFFADFCLSKKIPSLT